VAAEHNEIDPIGLGCRNKILAGSPNETLTLVSIPASSGNAATVLRYSVAPVISDSITCSLTSGTGASPPL
jgi:hypothetical protein